MVGLSKLVLFENLLDRSIVLEYTSPNRYSYEPVGKTLEKMHY